MRITHIGNSFAQANSRPLQLNDVLTILGSSKNLILAIVLFDSQRVQVKEKLSTSILFEGDTNTIRKDI